MAPSQSKLANALNALLANDGATVTETDKGIAIYRLSGTSADQLFSLLDEAEWTGIVCRDQGGDLARNEISANGVGLEITAVRPSVPNGVEAVVTTVGFEALLDRDPTSAIVWVEGLTGTIDTRSVRYCPWWTSEPFAVVDGPSSVAKVTRVLGRRGPGQQLPRWLLKDPALSVSQEAVKPWRQRATSRLLRSMAQEIEPDDTLLFKGPPSVRFAVANIEEVPAALFARVQSVAGWVLENERELENRHTLLAAEIARTAVRGGGAVDLAGVLAQALEGAKIAYNFGVTQQSRDTLKALGDLRKAVSDDTAKLSETMRTLGAAVAGAVFANIGLIVARLTLPTAGSKFIGPAAVLVGIILAIYVATVIGSGVHYIWVQRYLRAEWRNSLYRFLAQDDYHRLIEVPVGRAESAFWAVAIGGIAMVLLSLIAVWIIANS